MKRESAEDKLKDILVAISNRSIQDEEDGHWEADMDLIRTIRVLSNHINDPKVKALMDSIISTFKSLPKWYA